MGTLGNIQYDQNYSYATSRFLSLNYEYPNQNGPSPVIYLNHAALMSFMHVFDDLNNCQQDIHDDRHKIVTLCLCDRGIIAWNNIINVIDDNIRKVYIFCQSFSDFLAMKKWNGCYQAQIQDVYLPHKLDSNLLKLGVDHIHQILPEFESNRAIYNKFCAHGRDLLQALQDCYQAEIDNSDDDRESVEATG